MTNMSEWLTRRWLLLRLQPSDRGDVPGWVMVTLMTAGLVVVLWTLAGNQLQNVFNESMNRVLQH